MRQYWWVNHKKTSRHEIRGSYLWAPKQDGAGNSNRYRNILRAKPDDFVLSYSHAHLGAVGRVADYAFSDPRPAEFGRVGDSWEVQGWRLPVLWTPLAATIRTKPFSPELRALFLDGQQPPINAIGNGEQGVYLAEIGELAFRRALRDASYDRAWLERADPTQVAFDAVKDAEDDVVSKTIEQDTGLDATTRRQLIHARRGQGIFRERVRALEPSCRITGVSNHWLLVASHVKPWRFCKDSMERLDGSNGLMLTPDLDRLFDRGFITFEDHGRVRVSSRLEPEVLQKLRLDQLEGLQTPALTSEQATYMRWHREVMFEGVDVSVLLSGRRRRNT